MDALDPPLARPPAPWPRVALLALRSVQHDRPKHAVAWVTMFTLYLRPGELLAMQVRDVLRPTANAKWAA
eukprot:13861438-Alexandrium_andersonii.AAC.1